MAASCMLQSQYIESRGAVGKPGAHLEMKSTSDKILQCHQVEGDCTSLWTGFHLQTVG